MKKTGLARIVSATLNSIKGIRYLLKYEAAFRQELVLLVVALPMAFIIASSWLEIFALVGVLVLLLVVEALNTAIEVTVDRIGLEHHELSGLAKDLGSTAVLIMLLFASFVWVVIFLQWLI